MARLMSVAHTEQAVVDRRKTVTRRAGWSFLRVGDELELCRKVMGRKKGDPLVRICKVRVIGVRREQLDHITDADVAREGLTADDLLMYGKSGDPLSSKFVRFFIAKMGGTRTQLVTRIEWEYL